MLGVANIIQPSSSSSSISGSSASTKIGDLIEQYEIKKAPIKSCIIGISKLSLHWLNNNIAHTALFLSDEKHNQIKEEKEGIIIEFGFYPPEKGEEKKKEEDYIKNGQVIYRYEKQGGLRYYTNNYKNFIDFFCNVGYIKLNIYKDNYMTFSTFIDKIASISEKKWIKSNYESTNFNCQNFTADSIDVLKPTYDKNIVKGKNENFDGNNIENIIPNKVKNKLKEYEDK